MFDIITNTGCCAVETQFIPARVPYWYAVYTRSNFEKRVAAELESRGVQHFLPVIQEEHQWKDRKKAIDVPVFPGYVFARFANREEERLSVLRSNGVVRILGADGTIEAIPDTEIQSIQRLVKSGLPFYAYPFLREGTRVRITRGVLKDMEGTLVRFKNSARLVLSVNQLAQSIAFEVDTRDVEAI
ncbi:MAG TPA: UpxY family transcription antiterminator [Bryobacteraceae bacterium]|nr:UpxY family transcription antiterminator [Bryobacteraceae bacterium]